MSSDEIDVVPVDPRLEILDFAVALPSAVVWEQDEPELPASSQGLFGDQGIVGTITCTKKSANIWFGWGAISTSGGSTLKQDGRTGRVGNASNRRTGPLICAMPRTRYAGAFSSDVDPSTSKLVGCENEDDEMIARQMGSRISKRLGIAVFVSCSFDCAPAVALEGVDEKLINHRAASFAEREVFRILQKKFATASEK